ncbi:MAG: ABC transporter substrate-binding protein, partial [Bacillota bacterium]|nr:ABC transporter substrate-binding protein [Bacillota bacterium]
MSWIDLLGRALGKEGKATHIREYGNQVLEEIAQRTKDVKEEDKPRALLLINYNESGKSTSGKKQFARFQLEASGARHVAADVEETFIQLDMEQIYSWNPDVIYITTFSQMMPVDLYNNTAVEGDDWSVVKAVQDKRVHKFPLGIFHWYPPSADAPLALLWLAKNNHPDLFADVDLNQRVKEYYKEMYEIELTDEEVESIFASTRDAANQ